MRPKPLLEKQPHKLTLIGRFTVRNTFFFPRKFQAGLLVWFRYNVVSSEKMTWSQSIVICSSAYFRRLFWWSLFREGLDIGLNFAPASFNRRLTVLWLILTPFLFKRFSISRLVTDICWLAIERICWSCFGVVSRGRPERVDFVKSLDAFHRSIQYFTVFFSHLTAFATAFNPSLGPNGWQDKKIISYH